MVHGYGTYGQEFVTDNSSETKYFDGANNFPKIKCGAVPLMRWRDNVS